MFGAFVRYGLIIGVFVVALFFLGWLEAGRRGGLTGRARGSARFIERGGIWANLRSGAKAGYCLGRRLYHRVATERFQEMEMIRVAAAAAELTRQQIGETTVDYGNVLTTASATEYEKMAIQARMPAFKKAVEQALQRNEDHNAAVFETQPCVVDLSNVTVRAHLSADGRTYAEWSWAGARHVGPSSRTHSKFVTRLITDVLEEGETDHRAAAQSAWAGPAGPGDARQRTLTPEDSKIATGPRVRIAGTDAGGLFGRPSSESPASSGRSSAAIRRPNSSCRLRTPGSLARTCGYSSKPTGSWPSTCRSRAPGCSRGTASSAASPGTRPPSYPRALSCC